MYSLFLICFLSLTACISVHLHLFMRLFVLVNLSSFLVAFIMRIFLCCRFLSYMAVQRSKLQLVGTACMFIAAKYEEIYPPDVSEFVYITDDTYNKRQVCALKRRKNYKAQNLIFFWFLQNQIRWVNILYVQEIMPTTWTYSLQNLIH